MVSETDICSCMGAWKCKKCLEEENGRQIEIKEGERE